MTTYLASAMNPFQPRKSRPQGNIPETSLPSYYPAYHVSSPLSQSSAQDHNLASTKEKKERKKDDRVSRRGSQSTEEERADPCTRVIMHMIQNIARFNASSCSPMRALFKT